ncbi:MAG: isochorismate synthase [Flavobacteriales bacterium]|nr:isochorismate synthase [Flavobacteriales bacterium]
MTVRESITADVEFSMRSLPHFAILRLPVSMSDEDECRWFLPTKKGLFDGAFELMFHPSGKNFTNQPQTTTTKARHKKNVELAIERIKKGELEKVVLARVKRVKRKKDLVLGKTFDDLCRQHPNSLIHCLKHPEYGTWMGVSPELLLLKKGNTYRTVSLAGTQPAGTGRRKSSKKIEWDEKLLHEQKLVTDFITSALKKKGVNKISVAETAEVKSGAMVHLKTEIEFTTSLGEKSLLKILHPTPAVCGLPRNAAKKFILKNEQHQRRLYTGYLGITNKKTREALYFVNLRCMQVFDNHFELHVGGGITAASNPDKEWAETELKAGTLLNVLM